MLNYAIIADIRRKAVDKLIPLKTVKYNKHKQAVWITQGIISSIKFIDSMYKGLKMTDKEAEMHALFKHNLNEYNKILNKLIKQAKRDYYHNQINLNIFAKHGGQLMELCAENRLLMAILLISKSVINLSRTKHSRISLTALLI